MEPPWLRWTVIFGFQRGRPSLGQDKKSEGSADKGEAEPNEGGTALDQVGVVHPTIFRYL